MILTLILIFLLGMSFGAELMRQHKNKKAQKNGLSSSPTSKNITPSPKTPTAQDTEKKLLTADIIAMRAEKETLKAQIEEFKSAKDEAKKEFREATAEAVGAKNVLETYKKEKQQIIYDKDRNLKLSQKLEDGINDLDKVRKKWGLSTTSSIQAKEPQVENDINGMKKKLSEDNTLPNELLPNPYQSEDEEPKPPIPKPPKPKND
jgi:hypothetical protein